MCRTRCAALQALSDLLLMRTCKRRPMSGGAHRESVLEVESIENAARLESALSTLPSRDYDFVFIDTPGRDEPGEASAIRASSLTLIPCRPNGRCAGDASDC